MKVYKLYIAKPLLAFYLLTLRIRLGRSGWNRGHGARQATSKRAARMDIRHLLGICVLQRLSDDIIEFRSIFRRVVV